jgi:hypothetical protein
MQAIVVIEGTPSILVWTTDGTPVGNFCLWYPDASQSYCDATAEPTAWLDVSGDPYVPIWYISRSADDCTGLSLAACVATPSVELMTVSTSTPGYQVSSTYTPTYAATTSTSSPPTYHNVISADGVVLGGLMLVVIVLLLWKQSSAR